MSAANGNASLLSCLLRSAARPARISCRTRDPLLRSLPARVPPPTAAAAAAAAAAAGAGATTSSAILTANQISAPRSATAMYIRAAPRYRGPCHVCSWQPLARGGLLDPRRDSCALGRSIPLASLRVSSPSSRLSFLRTSGELKGSSSYSRSSGGGGGSGGSCGVGGGRTSGLGSGGDGGRVTCNAAGSGAEGWGKGGGEAWGSGRGKGRSFSGRGRGGDSWLGDGGGGSVIGVRWEEESAEEEGEDEEDEEEGGGKGRRGKGGRRGTRQRGAKKQEQMAVAEAYRRHYVAAVTAEKEDELAAWQQRMGGWSLQRLAEEGFALFNLSASPKGRFFKKRIVQFALAPAHGRQGAAGRSGTSSGTGGAGSGGGGGVGSGLLPQHHLLSQGDLVLVNPSSVDSIDLEDSLEGVVLERARRYLLVVMAPQDVATLAQMDQPLRLDLTLNTVSFDRAIDAVTTFSSLSPSAVTLPGAEEGERGAGGKGRGSGGEKGRGKSGGKVVEKAGGRGEEGVMVGEGAMAVWRVLIGSAMRAGREGVALQNEGATITGVGGGVRKGGKGGGRDGGGVARGDDTPASSAVAAATAAAAAAAAAAKVRGGERRGGPPSFDWQSALGPTTATVGVGVATQDPEALAYAKRPPTGFLPLLSSKKKSSGSESAAAAAAAGAAGELRGRVRSVLREMQAERERKGESAREGEGMGEWERERDNTGEGERVEKRARLNASQAAAIEAAMGRRVTLWQGPPGTGKTATLLHLMALARRVLGQGEFGDAQGRGTEKGAGGGGRKGGLGVRRAGRKGGERGGGGGEAGGGIVGKVLAAADSNVAVNNMVEGLLGMGLRVVRLGQPVKAKESLRLCTLDALVEAHPLTQRAVQLRQQAMAVREQGRAERNEGRRRSAAQEATRVWEAADAAQDAAALDVMERADVIAATCVGAGDPVLSILLSRHPSAFALCIIDEATQSTEPATLIPILASRASSVVLVGDPMQLPPTVVSQRALQLGLDVPLFSRLQSHGLQPLLLDTQYRMHPSIAAFPSAVFYSHRLLSFPTPQDRPAPAGFLWSSTAHPIAFIDCNGVATPSSNPTPTTNMAARESLEESPGDSTSWMNAAEAEQVVALVKSLLSAGGMAKGCEDIGIITPYRAQVNLIRGMLQREAQSWGGEGSRAVGRGGVRLAKVDLEDVEVKTVDGFQGREKEVIIVSTVRSNPEGRIGFVADARRLNVAVTRARRGLLVVGSRATLSCDPLWSFWLAHLNHLHASSGKKR
ncbi:unnamed protein product [Closterium sp. Naga37s-1]|nr:unnamed protein product [Closterium sp. Naga37s-1]